VRACVWLLAGRVFFGIIFWHYNLHSPVRFALPRPALVPAHWTHE
jgi:hypothetical protein